MGSSSSASDDTALDRLRPSPQTLVALAAVLALVAVVLAVAWESDVERPAAPRPQPTANGDRPPAWTPMDGLRDGALRDEKPDGLSAVQVANRWAQLFARYWSGEERYMTQPLMARVRCVDVVTPIEGCTPPSAEFRKSFQGASVERIVIRGGKASATFTNGEVVELVGADSWMIATVPALLGR